MKWVEALKIFNANKQGWCIPRKGTQEYAEVKALMEVKAEAGLKKGGKGLSPEALAGLRKAEAEAKGRNQAKTEAEAEAKKTIPASKAKQLVALLRKANPDAYKAMMEYDYSYFDHKLTDAQQDQINEDFRPKERGGLISGDIFINDKLAISFEPQGRFHFYKRR